MSIASNRELAENKLILLYILDKLNMPVSNLQLTKIVMENKLMNYFIFQQFLDELCSLKFISPKITDNKTYYTITPSGKQALDYFVNHIPKGIKLIINNYISNVRKNIRNETFIKADFTPENENEFTVTCQIREDTFSLIDLKISVGTKSDAKDICKNWQKHSQTIYSEIIESLIKPRD
ncbi:DUF4364 family protein [Acetivibrio saccincola]|uniref:DUF4364 domain-containing protein n=1 Tax=Acetivibrio saccincola TaxID=1677857 RepID=A0A2K9ENN2_9FIRM|nr:DUF4364 family protein [Acetivibrio saccincola]AUG58231.1 hypothetical protein HVS_11710 [Acetivibrio saccincola]PQQ68107.1 hypothetical protein B9R14_15905 [Acetivibrio saccincola]